MVNFSPLVLAPPLSKLNDATDLFGVQIYYTMFTFRSVLNEITRIETKVSGTGNHIDVNYVRCKSNLGNKIHTGLGNNTWHSDSRMDNTLAYLHGCA